MSSTEATIPSPLGADKATRHSSTLNLNTVLATADERRKTYTSSEDQAIAGIVEDRIANMDVDGDGRIDPKEMYVTMFDAAKEAVRQDKKIRTDKKIIYGLAGISVLLIGCVFGTSVAAAYLAKEAVRQDKKIRTDKKIIYGLAGISVLLIGCVFGTSVAAAYLAKDTQVNDSRALMTKSNEPVGINMNEVVIPLGSIAYLPEEFHKKVDMLTLRGTDGAVHTRKTSAVSVIPKKEMTIWTTNGDKITWDANDATAGQEVLIELAEGLLTPSGPLGGGSVQWTLGAGCDACTATNIVADESVTASVEEFYEDIIGVTSQEKRRALFKGCIDSLL